MKPKITNYSTYARNILSDSQVIARLIRKYSRQDKEGKKTPAAPLQLLTQTQIEQALLNPQNSLQLAISASAETKKMQRDVMIAREQAEAQRRLIKESLNKMQEKDLDLASEVQKEQWNMMTHSLRALQNQIAQQLKELATIARQLAPLNESLEKLTLQCNQDWEMFRSHYLQQLVKGIEAAGISLNAEEKKELLQQDTWSDLESRFTTLGIEIPDYIKADNPNYSSYFRMKGYLVLHAALGRQTLDNKADSIIAILKPLLKG